MVERGLSDMPMAGVVREFIQTEGGGDAGREIMRRVLGHAGLSVEEYATRPLHSRGGQPVTDGDGAPVTVENYLVHVARRYPAAVEGVLGFALTDPSDPSFEAQRAAIIETVEATT